VKSTADLNQFLSKFRISMRKAFNKLRNMAICFCDGDFWLFTHGWTTIIPAITQLGEASLYKCKMAINLRITDFLFSTTFWSCQSNPSLIKDATNESSIEEFCIRFARTWRICMVCFSGAQEICCPVKVRKKINVSTVHPTPLFTRKTSMRDAIMSYYVTFVH
jgi:hypothetical protein